MNRYILAIGLALGTAPALASDDMVRVPAQGDVVATVDALEAAIEEAGATLFARIDYAAGAQSVDMTLAPAQLVLFGNPRMGTPALQDDPLAGLYLPLRVLVYEDADGQVWLAYADPGELLDDVAGIPDDAAYVERMTGALRSFTARAAGTD